MRYSICDIETGKEFANITDLVAMYDNPKVKAYETVESMNNNLIKAGDVPCFKVVEIDDSNIVFLNREARTAEPLGTIGELCDDADDLLKVVEYLNAHEHETGKHYNIVSDNSKVIYLVNWR